MLCRQIIIKIKDSYKLNCLYFGFKILIIFFVICFYKKLNAIEFNVYNHLKELNITDVMTINEPFFNGVCRNIRMYTPKYHRIEISNQCIKDFKDKKEFVYRYRSPWVYFPMNGKFLRILAIGEVNKNHFAFVENGIRYIQDGKNTKSMSYNLFLMYQEMDNDNKNTPQLKLNTNNLAGTEINELEWYALFGVNCIQDISSENLACYNELDTSRYERFMFTGNNMKKYKTEKVLDTFTEIVNNFDNFWIKYKNINKNQKKTNIYFSYLKKNVQNNKIEVTVNKNLKYEEYENKKIEINLNTKTFWNGYLKADQTMENYIIQSLTDISNKRVLIMVPYDQVKLFIKTIKKIPNNKLKDINGYVWFLSKQIKSNDNIIYHYNPKKYDVLPNNKYDAELSRISNGNLKAKYGRYLTKERYSEDYVAPSIYGNNYNDKPEW